MTKKKQSKTKKKATVSTTVRSKNNWIIAAVIGLFAFALYANTLGHGYVLDDYSAIKDNYVTQKGFEGIPTIWTTHYRFGFWNSKAALYRPLTLTIFAAIWGISPDSTVLYHLVNVLFFAFTGMLLYLFLRKLMPDKTLLFPLAISMLFVMHPIHVEVVANIKSLDEILAFFFSLKAAYLLWKYLGDKNITWLIASVFVFALALFSKESSVMFVLVFPLLLYFFSKEDFGSIAKLSAPYLIPTVIFLVIRGQIVEGLGVGDNISFLDNVILGADGFVNQMAMTFLFLGKYLVNLILPYQLSSDFGYSQVPLISFANWKPLVSLVAYVGMGIYALIKIKDRDLASFGILFFLITFAPLSNFLIKIGTSYGDRMVYIPSLGFIIALVYLLFKFTNVNFEEKRSDLSYLLKNNTLPVLIVGAFLLAFGAKTIHRNLAWKDSYTLYLNDVETSPNSAKLRYHYGLEIAQKGLDENDPNKKLEWFTKAKNQFEKATEIYPDYHDSYAQLGLFYYRTKNYPQAMTMYQKAIDLKPNSPKAFSNMGIIYFEKGDVDNAQRVYEKAVSLDPKYVDALRNLGSVYARKKQFPKAIKQFSKALEFGQDDPTINYYLGSAYRDSGQAAKGKPYLDKACRLDQNLCQKK